MKNKRRNRGTIGSLPCQGMFPVLESDTVQVSGSFLVLRSFLPSLLA
ncbi:hypothetical protein HMPREF1548_02215 [Clostridium sp. KLE 1755]|nr:hypothetical protein HMPREF1548_02215 [Clostridium sp. KLE 1755]